MKARNQNQQFRQQIILSAASLGVALTIVGCDREASHSSKSQSGQRPAKVARTSKTGPVDERIRAIVVEQMGLTNEPRLTDRFVEDLGADSLDCVELVMALEEEFGFAIPDEQAEKLKTLGDAVAYVTNARK